MTPLRSLRAPRHARRGPLDARAVRGRSAIAAHDQHDRDALGRRHPLAQRTLPAVDRRRAAWSPGSRLVRAGARAVRRSCAQRLGGRARRHATRAAARRLPDRSAAARRRSQRAARAPRARVGARARQGRRSRARPEDAARRAGAGSRARRGARATRELAATIGAAGRADAAADRLPPRARARGRLGRDAGRALLGARRRPKGSRARCCGCTPAAASRSTSRVAGDARRPRASARISTRCSATCSTTPASGRARASRSTSAHDGDGVVITVDDDGPGLDAGDARGGAAARRARRRGRAGLRASASRSCAIWPSCTADRSRSARRRSAASARGCICRPLDRATV